MPFNGVKQGYLLAPALLSMFTAMLSDVFCNDDETTIKIRFRTDEKLFNVQTKVGMRLPFRRHRGSLLS